MQVTEINGENREPFFHMAPRELWEEKTEGYFYIGGLYESEDGELPVAGGCLIFHVQYEMIGERICKSAALKWLFVEEAYRRKGIAAGLLAEWKRIARDSGLDAVVFRLREDQPELLSCMEHCGFQLQSQPEEVCRMPLASVSEKLRQTASAAVRVSSLREIREQQLRETLSRLPVQSAALWESGYLVPKKDAYEWELSCATTEGGKLRTLLLMQKQSDIELRIVLLRAFVPNAGKELRELLRTAVLTAAERYSVKVWLELYCPDDRMKAVAGSLDPDGEFYRIRRGYCLLDGERFFLEES